MRQQDYREKESLQTIPPASLITSLALSSLPQITRSHYLKTTTWKKEVNDCPFFLSK